VRPGIGWEIAEATPRPTSHSVLALALTPSRERVASLRSHGITSTCRTFSSHQHFPASHSFRIEHLSRVYSVSHAIKHSVIGGLDAIMRMGD
jgi:hypothetical protein